MEHLPITKNLTNWPSNMGAPIADLLLQSCEELRN